MNRSSSDAGFELSIEGLRKVFPANGVVAVDDVSVSFSAGSVHAVVGENGAGKSTLMHVVAGYHAPDGGEVRLAGERVSFGSTRRAIDAGIHMVYQYPQVVGEFPLWEHMQLAGTGALISPKRARVEARELLSTYDLDMDIDTPVGELNAGQIYMVGIALAAAADPRVLILDEPTVGCTDREINAIFRLMVELAAAPAVIILVTHKLRDVFRVAHSAVVMRRGSIAATLNVAEATREELSRLILGAEPVESDVESTAAAAPRRRGAGRPAQSDDDGSPAPPARRRKDETRQKPRGGPSQAEKLRVQDVCLYHRGREVLSGLSFSVRSSEIVGMVGIRENGLAWVEEVVSGMRPPDSGTIELMGRDIAGNSPSDLRRLGLAYIPTDRLDRGASLRSSVTENLLLTRRRGMHRYGVLHRERISTYATDRKREFEIKGELSEPLFRLSGGNIQKVILSRELSIEPEVLVFAEPSWGLDLSTRAQLFRRLRGLRDQGTGVVLISTDLDDVLELADRIVIVRDGTIVATRDAAQTSRERIGRLMLGVE